MRMRLANAAPSGIDRVLQRKLMLSRYAKRLDPSFWPTQDDVELLGDGVSTAVSGLLTPDMDLLGWQQSTPRFNWGPALVPESYLDLAKARVVALKQPVQRARLRERTKPAPRSVPVPEPAMAPEVVRPRAIIPMGHRTIFVEHHGAWSILFEDKIEAFGIGDYDALLRRPLAEWRALIP